MVSHWILSDSKSPQVCRIILSIQVDLNNAAVWMVSSCPLISKSSSTLTVLCGLFQVHQLQLVSSSPSCSIAVLVPKQSFDIHFFFSISCNPNGLTGRKIPNSQVLSFLLLFTIIKSGRLVEIWWSVSQNPWEHCASHFSEQVFGYAFVRMVPIQFLSQFQRFTFHPVVSDLPSFSRNFPLAYNMIDSFVSITV